MGVVVVFAAPAHARYGLVAGHWLFEAEGCVLGCLGQNAPPARRRGVAQLGAAKCFAGQVLGHGPAHVPAHDLARAAVGPDAQAKSAPLVKQFGAKSSCRAATWVLRLFAGYAKASSYLRRLSGDDPLDFAAMTEDL